MDTFILTVSTLVGLTISVLVMSILFAITFGGLNVIVYLVVGSIVGLISGLAVYGLLGQIK
jgi:hypothetical protein